MKGAHYIFIVDRSYSMDEGIEESVWDKLKPFKKGKKGPTKTDKLL